MGPDTCRLRCADGRLHRHRRSPGGVEHRPTVRDRHRSAGDGVLAHVRARRPAVGAPAAPDPTETRPVRSAHGVRSREFRGPARGHLRTTHGTACPGCSGRCPRPSHRLGRRQRRGATAASGPLSGHRHDRSDRRGPARRRRPVRGSVRSSAGGRPSYSEGCWGSARFSCSSVLCRAPRRTRSRSAKASPT